MSCALWRSGCALRTPLFSCAAANWPSDAAVPYYQDTKNGRLTMTTPLVLGEISIHPVIEQQGAFFDALSFFPKLTKELLDENRSWLQPEFIDAQDRLVFCIQSFVIKPPRHNILIDACVGNHKPRPARPFWNMLNSDRFEKGLAAAGLTVNDVDYVTCPHLHTDHVGWEPRI